MMMAEEHRHDPLDHVVDNKFIEVPWTSLWTSFTGEHRAGGTRSTCPP